MVTFHSFNVEYIFYAIYRMLSSEVSPLDAGPFFIFCTLFLTLTFLSLTFLILSYVKTPILSIIPSFPPLWNYLLSKSGCESYALKIYLGVLYLPFGVILSLMVKQYEPFLAAVVYFIYQAIILFRRIRLLNRLLNKIYDLCSSDLGVKEYVRRDYGHFVLSMMTFKHAAERGLLIKRDNGLRYGFLRPSNQNREALIKLNLEEVECKNILLNSEEFLGLSQPKKFEAIRSLNLHL